MADTQWNIEHLLATAVAYMRDVGMPNEADAIIELQRRAATPPADAELSVPIEWRKIVRELMTVANFRPLCQKNVMEGCRCYDCVMQRAGELIDAQLWNN